MALTPTSSCFDLSTMNGNSHTARSPSLLSTHQSQRYLHQRIRELEHELEQKRLELFASEEARTELEARVNVDAYVKGSAMVSASCHTTDSYEDWQLNTQEEVENALRARNEEHELVLQDLHNYYRGFIAAIKNFHVVRRKAELQELQDDHCRIIDQIQEDHYAIRKKERLELVNNHLSMTAGAEKLEKAKFEQVKEEMCATYDIVLAHRDQRHDKAMAELQDAFQAELRLSNKDHEQEKTQLQQAHEAEKATMIKNHEAEHKAEVAEFDALRSVSEAMVEKCLNTRFSSHQAEIEAMETEYELAIENYEAKLSRMHERQKQELAEMKEGVRNDFDSQRAELSQFLEGIYQGSLGLRRICLTRFGDA